MQISCRSTRRRRSSSTFASPLVGGFGSFKQRLSALPLVQVVRQVVTVKLLTAEQAALMLALGHQRVLAQPVA